MSAIYSHLTKKKPFLKDFLKEFFSFSKYSDFVKFCEIFRKLKESFFKTLVWKDQIAFTLFKPIAKFNTFLPKMKVRRKTVFNLMKIWQLDQRIAIFGHFSSCTKILMVSLPVYCSFSVAEGQIIFYLVIFRQSFYYLTIQQDKLSWLKNFLKLLIVEEEVSGGYTMLQHCVSMLNPKVILEQLMST